MRSGHIAAGLAAYLNESGTDKLRFIASPMISETDRQAIREANDNRQQVLDKAAIELLENARLSEHAIARFAHRCLAYLVAANRMEIRFALLRAGLFHPKVWLISDDEDTVVIHGSSNFTAPGLLYNYETVDVERSWKGHDAQQKIERFEGMFSRLWERQDPNAVVIDASYAILKGLVESDRGKTAADDGRLLGRLARRLRRRARPTSAPRGRRPRSQLLIEIVTSRGTLLQDWQVRSSRGCSFRVGTG